MVETREQHRIVLTLEAEKRKKEGKCPACGKPKTEWSRRTDWICCSKECSEKYRTELVLCWGWDDLRKKVFDRDGWRCVKCGVQPTKEVNYEYNTSSDGHCVWYKTPVVGEKTLEVEGGKTKHKVYIVVDSSKLVADHIEPIALGGEQWDKDNIQTLCEKCNKKKTKKDQQDIAVLRRVEKNQKDNTLLSDFVGESQ